LNSEQFAGFYKEMVAYVPSYQMESDVFTAEESGEEADELL